MPFFFILTNQLVKKIMFDIPSNWDEKNLQKLQIIKAGKPFQHQKHLKRVLPKNEKHHILINMFFWKNREPLKKRCSQPFLN